MPTAKFRTKVSGIVANQERAAVIIAQSAAYLAYADQTDAFGLAGKIEAAIVGDVVEGEVWFDWVAPVATETDIEEVAQEFDQLAHVEKHECVSNPLDA